jgi:hypothetical protein
LPHNVSYSKGFVDYVINVYPVLRTEATQDDVRT